LNLRANLASDNSIDYVQQQQQHHHGNSKEEIVDEMQVKVNELCSKIDDLERDLQVKNWKVECKISKDNLDKAPLVRLPFLVPSIFKFSLRSIDSYSYRAS